MKLKDIIEYVNRKEDNSSFGAYTDLEDIAKEFDIHDYLDGNNSRIKKYYYKEWLCTDNCVGNSVYYLDNEPICISSQSSRKSDEFFTWINKEMFEKTRKYLLELISDDPINTASFLNDNDLNHEIGIGYKIEFNNQVIEYDVIFEETNEPVKIIEKIKEKYDIGRKINIRFNSGEVRTVELSEVIFPYKINSQYIRKQKINLIIE